MRLLTALLALCVAAAHAAAPRYDVCVVGAGPAGVSATVTLRQKGRSVLLLDRDTIVGGQAAPQYTDALGYKVHLGAVWVIPHDYTLLMSHVAKLGLNLAPLASLTDNGYRLLRDAGVGANLYLPNAPPLTEDFQALLRLFKAKTALIQAAIDAPGISATMALAPQLAVPMDEWLRVNGLSMLHAIVATVLSTMGYGHIHSIPAAFALKFITLNCVLQEVAMIGYNTSSVAGHGLNGSYTDAPYVFEGDIGYAEFLTRLLATSPGALELGVNITAVVRPPAGGTSDVFMTYRRPDGTQQWAACEKLLNTVGPTLSGLRYLSLDAVETKHFAEVFSNRYATTATEVVPPLPVGIYNPALSNFGAAAVTNGVVDLAARVAARARAEPSLMGRVASPAWSLVDDRRPLRGQPVLFSMLRPGAANVANISAPPPNVIVTYALADVPVSNNAYISQVEGMFSRGAISQSYKAKVKALHIFEYSPRVSSAALRGGWAARMEAMQGRRSTYHAGGGLSFWNVEHSMRSGRDVVNKYF